MFTIPLLGKKWSGISGCSYLLDKEQISVALECNTAKTKKEMYLLETSEKLEQNCSLLKKGLQFKWVDAGVTGRGFLTSIRQSVVLEVHLASKSFHP